MLARRRKPRAASCETTSERDQQKPLKAPFWELPGPEIRQRHARLAHGRGGWYVEAISGAQAFNLRRVAHVVKDS